MDDDIKIERLGAGDERRLANVAAGVFDNEVVPRLAKRYLQGAHNVLVVALAGDLVVGFASGLFYLHPDKEQELWVNEVGVATAYRRRGIGQEIMATIAQIALRESCRGCWVLTEPDNAPANALYRSLADWTGPDEQAMYSISFKTKPPPTRR